MPVFTSAFLTRPKMGYLPSVQRVPRLVRHMIRSNGLNVVLRSDQGELNLKLTPAGAGTSVLPLPDSISSDAIGNVTMEWRDAIPDLLPLLEAVDCRNVEQYRDRNGVYLAAADNGGTLVALEWGELMPFASPIEIRKRRRSGALVITGNTSSKQALSLTVVLYRATRLYLRGANTSVVIAE